MPHLSLSLLGAPEFRLDGQPITSFHSDKVRALLVYLAVESDRPHSRRSLARLLWTHWPEASARKNLTNALYGLRNCISDREAQSPFLHVTRDTIQFNTDSDHTLDVTVFSALARGQEQAHCWEQAVELYRGPFLEGFSLVDGAAFEDWARVQRERLARLAIEALQKLATHCEGRGELERACQVSWRRVELEPWREQAHRELMRLLALTGRRNMALAQFDACRRALAEELSVEPGEATRSLYEQIRDGGFGERAEAETEGGKEDGPAPRNLPGDLTPFIGRDRELAHVVGQIDNPGCRLLTLVGPGGSGKTRLALEAAAAGADGFRDGAFFVSLAPLRSAEAIVAAVTRALGHSPYTAGRGSAIDPWQHLLGHLAEKHLLLVLDNFEHLLDGVAIVPDILRQAPQIKILATSREMLNVEGEHLFPLGGMDVPPLSPFGDESALQAMGGGRSQYGAIQLFVSAARRAQPGFGLTVENAPHVVRICRLVGGLPLAILLAAASVPALTPAEIAAQVARSFDSLETHLPDVPERHRSVRACFDHSWHLLSERERAVFAGLSVFRGGFTWERALQVVGATLHEVAALVDKSLLHRASARRYQIHELLRQYAAEKLADTRDAGASIRDRHAATYAAALSRWATELRGPRVQAAATEMELEVEDARAAWDWAVERGQLGLLDTAMEGLRVLFWGLNRHAEGEAAFRLAAEKLEMGVPPRGEAIQGGVEALRVLARIVSYQAFFLRPGPCQQLLNRSLALLDRAELVEPDVRRERAYTGVLMAQAVEQYDHGRAKQLYERSLALYQAAGEQLDTAMVMYSLGMLAWAAGAYDAAQQWAERALAIQRTLGSHMGIRRSLDALALVAMYRGRLEEGERLMREAEAIWGGIPARTWWVHFARGRFEECLRVLEEQRVIMQDGGMSWTRYRWLCAARAHLGRYERARADGERGVAAQRASGPPQTIAFSLMTLSWAALAEGAHAEAERLLQESVALYRSVEQPDEGGWALACLAYACRALGRSDRAREYLCEAMRTGIEIGAFFPLVFGLPMAALLLLDCGRAERAVEVYALASRHAFVSNSRWFEGLFGGDIAAAAESLPPEVVVAARERGRALDLWETAKELLAELEGARDGDGTP